MVNDTDDSSYDELILQIKKWRSFGETQCLVTHRPEVSGTTQKDHLAICPAENKNHQIQVTTEDEVMLALEAAGIGTFRWDIRTGRITSDAALDRLIELDEADAVRSLDQFVARVHPDDRPEVINRWDRCRLEGLDFDLEFRVISPDGNIRWFHGRGKTIIEDGRPAYLTGACVDITKRKSAELRRGTELVARMSHEIRSPMTSILAYADILLGRLRDADDIECVKIIKQGGNHLLELIGEILDLSKIGSGKLKINREIVSLPSLINEVHSLMEVRAKEKHLPLLLHYGQAIPENIETDPTRLRQILFNLVSNAIKFTAQGSVRIIVRWIPNDSVLEIEVVDTGIGISTEQKARVFQPFVQADSATTWGQEGTGLGLAITKQLVDMMGGEIAFESEANRGSTFRVRMPVACSPAAATKANTGATCAATRRKAKVLLVDDNQPICKALGRLLEMAGHEVVLAFNGQSALEKAREFQADVAILDLKLPDMGGYELLARLKGLKTFQNTKTIALTGYGEEFRANARVEFDHFLTKPVDAKELETLLVF